MHFEGHGRRERGGAPRGRGGHVQVKHRALDRIQPECQSVRTHGSRGGADPKRRESDHETEFVEGVLSQVHDYTFGCRSGIVDCEHQVDRRGQRSEEHTSELQSLAYLVCRLLLAKKKNTTASVLEST